MASWDKTRAWMKTQGMDMSRVPEDRDEKWLVEQTLNVMDNAVMGTKIRQQMQPEPLDVGTVNGFVRHIYGDNPTPEQVQEGIQQFHQPKAKAPELGTIKRYMADKAGPNPSPQRQLEVMKEWNDSKKSKGEPPVLEYLIPYFGLSASRDIPYNTALNDLAERLPELMEGNPGMDALKTVEALREVYHQPSQLGVVEMLMIKSLGLDLPAGSDQDAPGGAPGKRLPPFPRGRPGSRQQATESPQPATGGTPGFSAVPQEGGEVLATVPDGRQFTFPTQADADKFIQEYIQKMAGGK